MTVLEPDGEVVDVLEIPGSGVTTNCCFGGADLRTLFATEAVPGGVVAWESMPTPGAPLTPWPGLRRDHTRRGLAADGRVSRSA